MSDYYCTISVENSNVEDVRRVIETEIGRSPFSICIDVENREENYAYTADFIRDYGLMEEEPVLQELDLSDFTVDVDAYCTENSFGLEILDIIADAIGCTVSQVLSTRTLVTLTNQKIPFCIFNRGDREQVFTEQSRQYFSEKFWLPETLNI